MKSIKVLGTGCPKCKKTEDIVRKVVEELGVEAQIEKVADIQQIISYNVLSTPAVVVDEEVIIRGRVPGIEELKTFLS